MTFREIIEDDNDVFINSEEFAEEHTIDGRPVLVSIDSDRLARRMQGDLAGLTNCDLLFYCKISDLGYEPSPGKVMTFDNKYAVIISVAQNTGLYEIILQFNRE